MARSASDVKLYGTIERSDGRWEIDTTPPVMIRLKRLFPRVQANRVGKIEITATREMAREIEWVLQRWPMTMDPHDRALLEYDARGYVEAEQEAMDILAGKPIDRQMAWEAVNSEGEKPHTDQIVGADLILATSHLLIADDLGMGKSLTGILPTRDPSMLPALFVCQTHLQKQWHEEIEDWTPLNVHTINSTKPYTFAKKNDGIVPQVLVIPYSKLASWAKLLAGVIKYVCFDEIQELRREGSQKYYAAGQIADAAEAASGLTATPVYNYGDEVHNIYDVLAPGVLGTREEFIREWGASFGSHQGVKEPTVLRAYLIDQNLMLQRTWKDRGIDRPKPRMIPHSIDSDDKAFDEEVGFDADTMAEILVARTASREELFKMSGQFDWRLRRATGMAKAPYVAKFVQGLLDQGEQILLFGWHHDVYDIWTKALANYFPMLYTGKQTPAQKNRAKELFMDGECRVLIMSLRSGAGLDGLQERAHIAVFGEFDWAPGIHIQCLGRLNRGAQAKVVLGYFLHSDHGADPLMIDTLNIKEQQAKGFSDPDYDPADIEVTADNRPRIEQLAQEFLASRRK